jgi:uncharacterized cupredoxin-like copper-binding protein
MPISGRRLGAVTACLLAVGTAAGCGATSRLAAGGPVVSVTERDFTIKASPNRVPAGQVVFQAHNRGPDAHELIVVREHDAALQLRSDGMTVNEEALKSAIVGTLEPGAPGSVRELHVKLKPGRYVLLCNMSGHYMGGMHTVVVVR